MAAAGGEPNAQECSPCHPPRSDAVHRGIWGYNFVFESVSNSTSHPSILWNSIKMWGDKR